MDDEKKEVKSDKGKTEISKYGRAILLKEYKALTKTPPEGISVGLVNNQIDEWEVFIQGPPDTLYEGGWFNANLKFPHDFPNNPPKMKFTTPNFWHPNVYKDGRVCISILHEAKEDELNPQDGFLIFQYLQFTMVDNLILQYHKSLTPPPPLLVLKPRGCFHFKTSRNELNMRCLAECFSPAKLFDTRDNFREGKRNTRDIRKTWPMT